MARLLRYQARIRHLWAACMLSAAHAALACPQKPPTGMETVTVGEDVVVDGIPLAVLQLRGREPPGVVLDRMQKEWTAAGFNVWRTEAAGWDIVSALSDKCLTTLQLSGKGGTSGYMAVSRPERLGAARGERLPLPPDAVVLTTIASNDDGRHGVLAVITTRQGPDALQSYYMRRLAEEKWEGLGSHVALDRNRSIRGALVSAQRGRERIEVVIWRDGQTHALVNLASAL